MRGGVYEYFFGQYGVIFRYNEDRVVGNESAKKLGSDFSSASDEELMSVCKQFEAYFIEQVLKEVQKTLPNQEEFCRVSAYEFP